MKFIIGKKLDMTQVWKGDQVIAVTKVQAGPCTVVQIKDKDKDKYEAIQFSYGKRKGKNIKKPQKNHFKNLDDFKYLREVRMIAGDLKRGDKINVSTFEVGDKIDVIGDSKGKGFQGVVKRHGFRGTKKTHGNKDQLRMPGSIGATGPAHVFKGTKMGGRMGGKRTTIKNLEIVEIDKENNTLLISGAVPGARNGLLLISGKGDLKVEVKSKNLEEVKKPNSKIKNQEGDKSNNLKNKNKENDKNDKSEIIKKKEKEKI